MRGPRLCRARLVGKHVHPAQRVRLQASSFPRPLLLLLNHSSLRRRVWVRSRVGSTPGQNKHSEQQPTSTLPDCLIPDPARAHSHDVPLISPKNVFSGKVSAFAYKPPKAPPGPPFFKLSPAQPVGVAASSREPTPSQPIPQRSLRDFFSGAWAGIGNGGGATTPEVGSNTGSGSAQASLATTTSQPAPESWQTQAAPKTQAGNSKSSTGKAGGLPKTDPTAAKKTPRLGRAGAGGGAMAGNTPQASQANRGMMRPGGGTGPAKARPKKGAGIQGARTVPGPSLLRVRAHLRCTGRTAALRRPTARTRKRGPKGTRKQRGSPGAVSSETAREPLRAAALVKGRGKHPVLTRLTKAWCDHQG